MQKKSGDIKAAVELHKRVPSNWYYQSLKVDLFQRFWHKKRFEEVSRLIEPVKGTLLDIGCADGVFSEVALKASGARKLIGIDVLEDSINWANKHWGKYKKGKMVFEVGDAHKLDFKPSTFDAVVALEVLEHVFNPEKVLVEIKRVLKRGGYALFLVPSDNILFRIVWFLWLHFYPRGWVWRQTHIQTYKNELLPKICKKVGFKVERSYKFSLGMLQAVKVRKV